MMKEDMGVPPSGSGCQPSASAVPASRSGIPNAVRRSMTVYEKPQPARLVLARALGISDDEAGLAIAALIEGGYGVAPRNPTNGMLAAYLEALTPPTGHEQVITAISKARLRWQAMLSQGTAMAMSRKFIAAQGIEAGTATTAKQGVVHESPVGATSADAPKEGSDNG